MRCLRSQCLPSRAARGRATADGARLLDAAAKLGHAAAAYDLGLLYLQGKQFPQDLVRAAQLFQQAADAGNTEAEYALATMYKEGRGVSKNLREAIQLMAAAATAGNIDAMVEFAIAAFNGTGTDRTSWSRRTFSSRPQSAAAPSRKTGWRAS